MTQPSPFQLTDRDEVSLAQAAFEAARRYSPCALVLRHLDAVAPAHHLHLSKVPPVDTPDPSVRVCKDASNSR